MKGPTRFRDDPGFEQQTGVSMADEASALTAHDVGQVRRRVFERVQKGDAPGFDPTAGPGALNVILTALGVLTAAGAMWLAAASDAEAPREIAAASAAVLDVAAIAEPAVLSHRAPKSPTIGEETVQTCLALPIDLVEATPIETEQAPLQARKPRPRALPKQGPFGALPVLTQVRLHDTLALRLSLPGAPTDQRAQRAWSRLPLTKDLVSAVQITNRFKVFK